MGILDEDVQRVRETADLVAIITGYTQLKKVGRRWVGLCPFHGEKTPSLSVNAEDSLWYCFGCQAKGDAISFVRDMEHLDFVSAVEWLASKSGITLRYTDRNESESRREKARLTDAMEQAVEWYHQRLLTSSDAGAARRYLRDRGLDGDTVRRFRIGWAPDDWDAMAKGLHLPRELLRETGLAFVNRRDRLQDFFRGRILFPIFDPQGHPISFGGRKMPGADGPKYQNLPETKLYSKSKVLYGLHWAKDEIVRSDEVVVCEGYTDVIGFASVGVQRAVATCGTALTEEHVRLLTRFAHKVVLSFDPDGAGRAAAERFYEWERKYEIDVAVADLPSGQDPGDLSRRDPARLQTAVTGAIPFLGFRVGQVLAAADLGAPEGRARAAEAALGVIVEHPSELVRDQYLMEVADRCRLDPDRLRTMSTRVQPASAAAAADGGRGADRGRSNGTDLLREGTGRSERPGRVTVEVEALRLAVTRPSEILPRIDEVLFSDGRPLGAFRALRDADSLPAALDAADPLTAELLGRLAVEDTEAEPDDVVILLLRDAATRAMTELESLMRRADDPLSYSDSISWLKHQIVAMRPDDPPGREAEEQLLRWLRQRVEERG
jgi:DNA primase